MSVSQMICAGKSPVSRLIVGTGEVSKEACTSLCSVGFVITSQLLEHCSAPKEDIYDPSVDHTRSAFRDEHGYARKGGEQYRLRSDNIAESRGSGFKGKRGLAPWSFNPFQDYNGLYCDRIALGNPPTRTAVLQPHTGLSNVGRSMSLFFRSHRSIASSEILFLYPTRRIPFGGAVLSTLRQTEKWGLIDLQTQECLLSANRSVVEMALDESVEGSSGENISEAGLDMCVLSVGVGLGDNSNISLPMSDELLCALRNYLAPKFAYTCAYWCTHPKKASEFLSKDLVKDRNGTLQLSHESLQKLQHSMKERTQFTRINGPFNLVSSSASSNCENQSNLFSSKALQKPLLSNPNQQIVEAYGSGVPVMNKSTMNAKGTFSAANRILQRVSEQGYWTVPS